MYVWGAVFVAGATCEAVLLVASIAAGWTAHRLDLLAFLLALLIGVLAIGATAALGRALMRSSVKTFAVAGGRLPPLPPQTEARTVGALIVGIAALVLIWPLGVFLGPLALWLGLRSVRRIKRSPSRLDGRGMAVAAAVMGSIVCGLYLGWILVDVAAVFAFGSPIPAAD